jgi:heme-degrading monooxygenase HmoA
MAIEHDAIPTQRDRHVVQVTALEGAPERIEFALRFAREQMGAFQQQEGWLRTVGLTSLDGRRALIIGFWESDDAYMGSRATLDALRERSHSAGIEITDVSRYEVVFDDHVE